MLTSFDPFFSLKKISAASGAAHSTQCAGQVLGFHALGQPAERADGVS